LAAIVLVHGASAAELDPEVLRGSMAPSYSVAQIAPWPEDTPLYSGPVYPHPAIIDQAPLSSWTGLYIGAHIGAGLSRTDFSDPFGGSVFGDTVRSPGFLGGAHAGFNWQPAGLPWVFGIEAAGDFLTSTGTNTCAGFSGFYVTANCRANPHAFGAATARIGHTFGPANRTLVYVKGGPAWVHTDLASATNNLFFFFPQPASNFLTASSGGWTVGAGVERALTPAWLVADGVSAKISRKAALCQLVRKTPAVLSPNGATG
jgi:opacity protein-like surface antigen